jgi:3-hydroxyacyl-CoA dehydrogenase
LATDRVSRNLIHGFRLAQEAKKSPPPAAESRAIDRIGVLGSGVMGTGIAHLVAVKAELPVRLHDNDPLALCRSLQQCALLTRNRQRRGRLSAAAAAQALARLEPSLCFEGFGRVDLVLEAVTEDPALKTQVLQAVAARLPATTVLATNTSSLSIDSLAAAIEGPERFVGLHFFNPVHQVPLVEVVAGSRTSAPTLAAAEAFARRLGKTPLRVRDRPGFLINRLLSSYLAEALWLLAEGHAPDAVDAVLVDWGFPVGPFELIDRIGIDLALAVARRLADTFPHRLVLPRWNWQEGFLGPGFLGLKSGRGFYRYDQGQKLGMDPELTSRLGLPPARRSPDPLAVTDRLILPMVNEAAVALAEDLVDGPATVDLAMLLGAGFPPFRGGLCRWADQEGPAALVQVLDRLAGQVGERFAPTQALREVARRGSFYGPSSAGV